MNRRDLLKAAAAAPLAGMLPEAKPVYGLVLPPCMTTTTYFVTNRALRRGGSAKAKRIRVVGKPIIPPENDVQFSNIGK